MQHIWRKLSLRAMVKHLLALGTGLLLIGVLVVLGGTDSLAQLGTLHLLPLLGALLLTIGINSAIAGRWGTLANALAGRKVAGWYDYLHYFLVSRALGFVLPKDVTDLGSRTVYLNQMHGMPLAQASASVLLDRLADLLTAGLFCLAVLPFWLGWLPAEHTLLVMLTSAALGGGVLLFAHRWLARSALLVFNRALALLHRLPFVRSRSLLLLDVDSLRRRTVLAAYLFSMLKFGCTAGRMVCFMLTLDLPISPLLLILGTPLGQFSYLFAFTPGGLGIFEAGWFAILSLGDVAVDTITAFVVGQRVLTVVLIVGLALCSQLIYLVRQYALRPPPPGDSSHNQTPG